MMVILLRQHCCPRALDIISAAAEHSSQRRGWNGVLYRSILYTAKDMKRWQWWTMKVGEGSITPGTSSILCYAKMNALFGHFKRAWWSQAIANHWLNVFWSDMNWHFFPLPRTSPILNNQVTSCSLLYELYGATCRRTFLYFEDIWSLFLRAYPSCIGVYVCVPSHKINVELLDSVFLCQAPAQVLPS